MKWPLLWRLNLILFLWIILSLAFFVRPARADNFVPADRTNYHMQETNAHMEIKKAHTDVINKSAPNVRNGVEFVRQDGRTHGVDMRLNAPLPDFDTESSYEPRNLQSEVEREMQDRQTTDYVVERSWREIRKDLEQQTQNYVNYN
jgi:hypothetical protein